MIRRQYFACVRVYHSDEPGGGYSELSFSITTKGLFSYSADKLMTEAKDFAKRRHSERYIHGVTIVSLNRI